MQEIRQLGKVKWSNDEIKASIPEFLEVYARKPINDNQGGMKSPHMFATWFMLRKLKPANVIESGVWKGQGTWMIENALPDSNIFSIDINLGSRKYISHRVKYFNKDFNSIDWSFLDDKEETVLFFDDHQNALERVMQAKKLGFKKFIFEDNYPAGQGDCYSLKKAFQHAGSNPRSLSRNALKLFIKKALGSRTTGVIEPNSSDAGQLQNILEVYYEFPPVFKTMKTRWRDAWTDSNYPTPEPLFSALETEHLQLFYQEAVHYTWICYAKLK